MLYIPLAAAAEFQKNFIYLNLYIEVKKKFIYTKRENVQCNKDCLYLKYICIIYRLNKTSYKIFLSLKATLYSVWYWANEKFIRRRPFLHPPRPYNIYKVFVPKHCCWGCTSRSIFICNCDNDSHNSEESKNWKKITCNISSAYRGRGVFFSLSLHRNILYLKCESPFKFAQHCPWSKDDTKCRLSIFLAPLNTKIYQLHMIPLSLSLSRLSLHTPGYISPHFSPSVKNFFWHTLSCANNDNSDVYMWEPGRFANNIHSLSSLFPLLVKRKKI